MNFRRKYPWINDLPPQSQEDCIADLKATRDAHRINVIAWRNTANIYTDPNLLLQLQRDTNS